MESLRAYYWKGGDIFMIMLLKGIRFINLKLTLLSASLLLSGQFGFGFAD
jgi:hypothetical protein